MISEQSDLFLVYFNCRGIAQLIRYTLYEIGVEFEEIHIGLNQQIPPAVSKYSISPKNLPCIIHENRVIRQIFPIVKYLCLRFNRGDLMGRDIRSQVQLVQVFYRFEKRKCATLMTIFKNVSFFIKNPDKEKETKENLLKEMKEKSLGFEQACCLLYSNTGGFLFDDLTVLDFIFYEKTFYYTNLFGQIAKKKTPIMFAYKNFFQRTGFYKNNIEKIQKFKLMMPMFDSSINQGLNKLWVGDKKFLTA